MIKRGLHNAVALLAAITIVAMGLAQFHHHTADGKMHIVYGMIIEAALGHDHQCEHQGANPIKHDCGLQLDVFDMASSHQQGHAITPLPVMLAIIDQQVPIIDLPVQRVRYYYHKAPLPHHGGKARGLRAPPAH